MENALHVIEIVGDAAIAASAVTGALVAVLGLSVWRKQIRGQHHHDVARRTLKSIYTVREAIGHVRSPFITPSELVVSLEEAGYTQEEISARATKFDGGNEVYSRRWSKVSAALAEFDVVALEAEVIWGSQINELFVSFRTCIGNLKGKIYLHFNREMVDGEIVLTKEEKKEIRDAMYANDVDSGNNGFTNTLKSSIKALEEFIRSHLEMDL